jgi:hypothetical protein
MSPKKKQQKIISEQADVQKALTKKGFRIDTTKSDHVARLYIDGKATHISCRVGGHSRTKYKNLKNWIHREMRRLKFDGQIIDKNKIDPFLWCEFSIDEYVNILKERGEIIIDS